MTGWIISICATAIAMVMLWLYGNGDRRAPWLELAVCLCWACYDVLFAQWPLLLPTAINCAIHIRNLLKMKAEAA